MVTILLVAGGSILAVGCGPEGTAGPFSIQDHGLAYTAELVESGPEILIGTVTISNRGLVPRTLRFPDPCVAMFRFHDRAQRPVWDQHPTNKTCVPPGIDVVLEPGEAREFERFAYAPAILTASDLPGGRYRIVLYVRPDGREVTLELGEVELLRPPPFQEQR